MLKADEDGRIPSLHNKFLLYIFKCKWNREIGHLLTKNSSQNLVQFNQQKHLLQCRFKYNDGTIKIQDGQYCKLPCIFLQTWNQYKAEAEACSFAGDGVFHCIGSVKGNLAKLRTGFR